MGRWLEVFNGDVCDNWVIPLVAGLAVLSRSRAAQCTALRHRALS